MAEESSLETNPLLLRRARRVLLIAALIAVVLAIWGIVSRTLARSSLAGDSAAAAVLTVITVKPAPSPNGEELVLPGTVQGFIETPIYARTSGFVKAWYTDIGAQVKRGQLLADIETPEVDQQLRQAQADLATAQANEQLAATTNERWQKLLATDSVSKQDAEQKAADAAAKKASVASAAANLARLNDLESFKRVVAPYDGIVTARNTDVGALINAGQTPGSELFRIAVANKLRIYVQVPEPYAASTKVGVEAELHFTEQARKIYTAKTVRTASALDPVARTLQVELQLDNPRLEVLPGAYTEVHFKLPADAQVLRLPSNTLLFRSAGLQVATVDANQHVKLKNIVQGRDFGSTVEVLSGVDPGDSVILNPPDSTVDGTTVRIARKAS